MRDGRGVYSPVREIYEKRAEIVDTVPAAGGYADGTLPVTRGIPYLTRVRNTAATGELR